MQSRQSAHLSELGECTYKALLLGEVTTISEAALLFGKGKTTVYIAAHNGKLECRQALTGGCILITLRSLVKLWGAPKIDLETFYTGKGHKRHDATTPAQNPGQEPAGQTRN